MITDATVPAIVLALLDLLWIGVLARIFFRPGDFNAQWWLNTVPFVLAGGALLGVLFGAVSPHAVLTEPLAAIVATTAALLCATAFGLMGYTLGTHRRRLALWHQTDDTPEHLVTEGPYARVRHPFYTSYLITLVACALVAVHWSTVLALVFGIYRLNGTAAAEEARFLDSKLGQSYADYMRSTGRFVPILRARTSV